MSAAWWPQHGDEERAASAERIPMSIEKKFTYDAEKERRAAEDFNRALHATSGEGPSEIRPPSGAFPLAIGSAVPAEVIEAFKRLHAAWLSARKRSDMNEQMDALAMALQLHPHTLAPLNAEVSDSRR